MEKKTMEDQKGRWVVDVKETELSVTTLVLVPGTDDGMGVKGGDRG